MLAVPEELTGPDSLPSLFFNHNSSGIPFGKVLGTGPAPGMSPARGGCSCTWVDVPTCVPGGNGLAKPNLSCRLLTPCTPNTLSYRIMNPWPKELMSSATAGSSKIVGLNPPSLSKVTPTGPCSATKRLPPTMAACAGWQMALPAALLPLPLLLATGIGGGVSMLPPPHAPTSINAPAATVARNAALRFTA